MLVKDTILAVFGLLALMTLAVMDKLPAEAVLTFVVGVVMRSPVLRAVKSPTSEVK